MSSSDNSIHDLQRKIQAHVVSFCGEAQACQRDAEKLSDFSKLIGQVGNVATSRARQRVMDVSSSDGGLLGYFQACGGDERALQRMMAECIGTIDEILTSRAQVARDGATASTARGLAFDEQAAAMQAMLSPCDPAEPDAS